MLFKGKYWSICLFMLLAFLTSCSNGDKEAQTYYEDVYSDAIDISQTIEEYLKEFSNAVRDKDSTEVMNLLTDQIIPSHDEMISMLEDAELKNDDLVNFNDISIELVNSHKKLFVDIENILKDVIKLHDSNQDIQIDQQLKNLSHTTVKQIEMRKTYQEEMNYVSDEFDVFSDNELELLPIEHPTEEDLHAYYEQFISDFTKNIGGSMSPTDVDVTGQENDLEVVFDGEVTVDDTFIVKGKTNLPEGAMLQIRSYHYGSEHTYIRGETKVEDNGTFHFEQDIDKDALTGEPIEIQVQFIPHKFDNKEFQEVYGEEGENIQGSFTQKVTDAKRSRTAAIASVLIELTSNVQVPFDHNNWDKVSDYGDFNVWMEVDYVDIKDDYYDIYIDSNLIELTGVKASLEVPGYDIAGYTSRGVVRPDGSIRIQIPRPEINDSEVILILESNISRSIESEEYYGENGEELEGNLVEKDDKGQRILYESVLE